MSCLLNVKDVHIRFQTKGWLKALIDRDKNPFIDVVCGVSFQLEKGKTLGLLEKAGLGKAPWPIPSWGSSLPKKEASNFKERSCVA